MSTIQRDLATELEEGERLKAVRLRQLTRQASRQELAEAHRSELDESVCADISEVVSQRAWFDSNGCEQTYHGFHRINGRVQVFHSNNELCGVSEYFLPLNAGG